MHLDEDEDWGAPPRRLPRPAVPEFHVEGFDGPLDLLLDLAERQRLDLGVLSIADLAAQFVAEAERLSQTTPLMQRADWVIWIARLVFLRSRRLFATQTEKQLAENEARRTVGQIEQLLEMRAAADWLEGRPQLGVSVFARGGPRADSSVSARQGTYFSLMEACLNVLEQELSRVEISVPVYRINVPAYWRVTDALALVREKIANGTFRNIWEECIPPMDLSGPDRTIDRRAAVAATFVAGLELVRQGNASIDTVVFPMA
ncbi:MULTISPECIES: segregation and condensation protein A [Komagataeibacter]|uniref:Segregation and condensation protein A n=1 Tax=Komagataeibacter oboediens TaxID=65958 RepID=A0ABS5STB9_9PROT|nr:MULTISPECIES: aromatic-ring-hydroxylating dioxygenase [Komagataeibacter]MBT0677005.1 segregation/condensation protein A [Komagataeibacter oboediens]MBT0680333.1 segregation/condensation protein A [Komagataeibacter oboediens]GCE90439.1 chromosome segregation and condensation protein [Komagataeibacter diospyri]